MAYSKTTWATGDVITAAKLNNIEDGVAANDTAIAGLAPYACDVTFGEGTVTFDKKAGELFAAIESGRLVKMTGEVSEGVTAEVVLPIAATKIDASGTVTYAFRIVNAFGEAASVASLSADDTVVLTEEE